jgi:hypothetical protein
MTLLILLIIMNRKSKLLEEEVILCDEVQNHVSMTKIVKKCSGISVKMSQF